jgi:hypothetical protein
MAIRDAHVARPTYNAIEELCLMALRDIEAEVAFEDWVVDDLSWDEDRDIDDLADVLRQALGEEYGDASDDELIDALADVFERGALQSHFCK